MLWLRRGLTIVNKRSDSAYPIYRVVIQRFLTVYVKFRRYVPELSMNCNGERIQRILELLKFFWVENRRNRFLLSDHHRFTGRKFSHCYHRLRNDELKKTDKLFYRKHGLIWFAVSSFSRTPTRLLSVVSLVRPCVSFSLSLVAFPLSFRFRIWFW